MQTLTLDEVKTRLHYGIEAAIAGEDVFITRDGLSVKLVPQMPTKRARKFGGARIDSDCARF